MSWEIRPVNNRPCQQVRLPYLPFFIMPLGASAAYPYTYLWIIKLTL